jgi:hypothetical protein
MVVEVDMTGNDWQSNDDNHYELWTQCQCDSCICWSIAIKMEIVSGSLTMRHLVSRCRRLSHGSHCPSVFPSLKVAGNSAHYGVHPPNSQETAPLVLVVVVTVQSGVGSVHVLHPSGKQIALPLLP